MFDISFILKLLKFGLVGISGMAVDFGTTSFFKEILKVQKYISNSTGFTLAATSNYILNRLWTFNSTNPEVLIQYLKFFIIAVLGLLLNNLTIWFFTDYKFRLNFYLSKGIATLLVFFWNFFMNYFFTF
ncbi:MAG: GtrA family protein [Bacteroidota bacterium]|nr:GtrA family protein [Bacteroidota bacterium]